MIDTLEILLVGITAALISYGGAPLAARLAGVLKMEDRPSSRKVHLVITPYLGGLAVLAGWSVAFLTVRKLSQTLVLLVGMIVLGIVGFIDDRRDLSPHLRLAIQLAVAMGAWAGGVRMTPFDIPMIDFGLTVLWLVGITNAFNFMDNMDGLAAGVGAIGALCMGLTAVMFGQKLVAILAFGLAGACLGFLRHNQYPARIFMGDTGTMPLGFGLAVVAIKVEFPGVDPFVAWAVPVLALGLFILDTSVMTMGRLLRRERLIGGRTDHISHRLLNRGAEVEKVVRAMYLASALFGLVAVISAVAPTRVASGLLIAAGSVMVVALVSILRLPPLVKQDEDVL